MVSNETINNRLGSNKQSFTWICRTSSSVNKCSKQSQRQIVKYSVKTPKKKPGENPNKNRNQIPTTCLIDQCTYRIRVVLDQSFSTTTPCLIDQCFTLSSSLNQSTMGLRHNTYLGVLGHIRVFLLDFPSTCG